MAINPFVIKKWAVLLLAPCLSTIFFFVGLTFYGMLAGIGLFSVALLLGGLVGTLLLKNPFTIMLEGKGLLVFNLDSTGVLHPFNVGLDKPYIKGKYSGTEIKDIFDRSAVYQIAPPVPNKPIEQKENGNIVIELDTKQFNDARLAMFHFPCLIWNDQLKTLMTKEDLMQNEKTAFAEHNILFLNKQVEDLNKNLLNFGRYVVEQTKPQNNSIWANKWTWVVIAAIVIIGGAMLAPMAFEFIKSFSQVGGGVIGKTAGAVTPIK